MEKQLPGILILFILFVAGLGKVTKADELVLASNSSGASIVIGINATDTEKYAAEELQRCIRIMSGAELSIVNSSASVSGAQIIIGTPAGNDKINEAKDKLHLNGLNDEQTAVLREGSILYLGGQTPRAALYATYTFLQDVLGVRWLWPGDSGEFIPQRSIISVNNVNLFEVPTIAVRSFAITSWGSGNPETDAWEARNRMNMISIRYSDTSSSVIQARLRKGFQLRISGHFIVLPQEILTAHPEYAALYNGSRSYSAANRAQLCWGNSGVQNEVANLLKGLCKEVPFIDGIQFFPADNQSYCTDALCKSLAPDVSTRWQKFSQIVMEKADVTYPGKRYWTLAYQGYKDVPQIIATRFESIGYTLYEASYRHLLSSGYSGSAGAIAEIDGWKAKGAEPGIRGYEYIMFRDPMFVPMVSWEVDQMAWMAGKGIINYSSELPAFNSPQGAAPENTYWMTNRMNLYAAAKAMWDSKISADSLVKDWCETIYGPAAGDMMAYYRDIENAWKNAPGDIQEYNNTPASQVDKFLSPEVFIRLNGYFSQARSKLAGISDEVLRNRIAGQIDLESKMLANWQKVYNFKENNAGHFETVIEKLETLNNTTWNSVTKLPAFKDQTGEDATEQTVVSKAWTNTDLNFRITCQDDDIASRIANATVADDINITADDCVELYIQPNPNNSSYIHLAVNTLGKKYDAISKYGGTDFDKSWDPQWTATVWVGPDGWTVDIKIPFSSLGINAQDSSQFKMAIKRSRGGRAETSGWPDASYFNPATFGLATLVSEIPNTAANRVILFDQGGTSSGNVSTEFQQRGWEVVAGITGEADLKDKLNNDAAVLLLRSTALSNSFYLNEIKNYIEKGRVVIISTASNIAIDQWFPGTPKTIWSGNNKNIGSSKSSYQLPGKWQTYPNNISNELKIRPNPVTAFSAQSDGWRELLKMPMKDGTDQPFLLSRRIGNGLLVLTSSNMGYSGGYEVFGSRNITNAVKLVENFVAEKDAFPVIKRAQTITLDTIPEKVFGEPDFAITATSDSGLPVTLTSSNKAVAIISDGVVHLKGVGTTIIVAAQEGNETFQPAENVSGMLVVIPDTIAPTIPAELSATATDSIVTLNWRSSSDFIGVTHYNIYRDDELIGATSDTTASVNGLRSSVTYAFKVVAVDAADNQSSEATISVTTPDTQAPGAPPALIADKTNKHKVALSWLPSTDNVGVIGYNVFQNGVQLNTFLITGTSYLAERPIGKDVYEFTVKALDAAGNISVASNSGISANGNIKSQASRADSILLAKANEGIVAYPNPSNGTFKLNINTSQNGLMSILIFDQAGTLMQRSRDIKDGPYVKDVDLSGLPAGVYVVRIIVNNFSQSKTVIISK